MDKAIDVARARRETASCYGIVHLNNAGTSLIPIPVSEALHNYLQSEKRIEDYETEALYADELGTVYRSAAKLINSHSKLLNSNTV